jgi:hypothetical protein
MLSADYVLLNHRPIYDAEVAAYFIYSSKTQNAVSYADNHNQFADLKQKVTKDWADINHITIKEARSWLSRGLPPHR